jgi:hypothetical protein
LVVQGVAVLRAFKAGDPSLRGGERDSVAGLAGTDRQRDAQCVLPVPGE